MQLNFVADILTSLFTKLLTEHLLLLLLHIHRKGIPYLGRGHPVVTEVTDDSNRSSNMAVHSKTKGVFCNLFLGHFFFLFGKYTS